MKKIFTLIAMAFVAMSVNAQDLPENVYPYASITWGDITWEVKNNRTDIETPIYIVMGQGNAYENVYCEYFTNSDGNIVCRPFYTYLDYEAGKTGIPGYGLYYKFTPKTSGTLKVCVWVNKGNRKTFVVKGSTGTPLTPYVDYTVEGYVNGTAHNTETPVIDETTGQQKIDNDGNLVWVTNLTFLSNSDIQARVAAENERRAGLETPQDPINTYVIDLGNQAFWGWLTFNVEANESYYVFQTSSQLGFGGFEFGSDSYVSAPGGSMSNEFNNGVADDKGEVVTITTANMTVEAVGSSTPTDITPDLGGSGISTVKAENATAVRYNMAGQKVNDSFKGIVIENGRKFMSK